MFYFYLKEIKFKKCVAWFDGEKKLPWIIEVQKIEKKRKREPAWNLYLDTRDIDVEQLIQLLAWKKDLDLIIVIGIENSKTSGMKR